MEQEGDDELFANVLSSSIRGLEAQQWDRLQETMRDPGSPTHNAASEAPRVQSS